MRIGNDLPVFMPSMYLQTPSLPQFSGSVPALQGNEGGRGAGGFPGIVLDISPAAWAAAETASGSAVKDAAALAAIGECATCDSRRYVDQSDDSSVSFQTPTHISPGQSAAMVAAHEAEHVANEQARADREGYEIVSQTVTLRTSICPECNIVYVSGGETRTVSRHSVDIEV